MFFKQNNKGDKVAGTKQLKNGLGAIEDTK